MQVVIQLVYTGILARKISTESFAIMGVVLAIMGFAELFSQIGIGPALVQRKEIDQHHINSAFYTSVVLGLVFTLSFVLAAPFIARLYEIPLLEKVIQVVCSSFFISAMGVVPRSLMIKNMRFKNFFYAATISIIGGNVIIGLTLAYLGYDIWAYVWALFAQNALMTLAFWLFQPVKISASYKWSSTRSLIRYGGQSTLFNALNFLATKLDVILIPLLNNRSLNAGTGFLEKAALYERSNYIMTQPITIMGKLSDNVLFSGMSKIQDEHAKLRKTLLVAINLIMCVVVPASVFVVVFSEEIIRVYLGEKFMEAVPVLQILFVAVVFRSLSKLGDSLFRAKDVIFQASIIKATYLALIATGILISIPFGMPWVALSVVISTFIHCIMSLYFSASILELKTSKIIKTILPALLLGVFVMAVSIGCNLLFRQMNCGNLVTLLFSFTAVCICTFLVIYRWPTILGNRELNPIHFLPERIKNNRLLKPLFVRFAD